VCIRCGRGKCLTCRGQDEKAEAKARREQHAREQAARQARNDAHAADVRASTAQQAKSQQQYIAELRRLDREIGVVNARLRKNLAKFSVGYAFSALVGLGFWIVALIIIVKTPVKVISVFPLGIGLAFMSPVIMWANGARRTSKAASLKGRRDALLPALGCGRDCEYGCRRY
jgi:hypothetical protein